MSTDVKILERLTQTGVFFWDATQDRVFEVSDNFRDFLGVSSNRIGPDEMLKFFPKEGMDLSFRKVGLGEMQWNSFLFVRGKEIRLRCVKLSQYFDSDGRRHSVGTATVDDPEAQARTAEPLTSDEPISIFDGKQAAFYGRQSHAGFNVVYDQIADMAKAFRAHFPPDVVVSVWKKIGNEYLCVAVAGKIMTASRTDVFKVGFRHQSLIVDKLLSSFGVHVLSELGSFASFAQNEVDAVLASGWMSGAISAIRSIDDGGVWGSVSCFASHARVWSAEEKQRLQLLSDSISVLLAQSSAYSQVFHNLVLTRLACEAGGFFTWQWNVEEHRRTLVMVDGSSVVAPYELAAHHDDREAVMAAYKSVEQGQKPSFSIRARFRIRPGEALKWYEVAARAVTCDNSGKAKIIVGVARDVDEVVRAEEIKQKEVEQRETIYNKMPAVFALFDAQGREVYTNQKAAEVFGVRSVDELKGLCVFDHPLLSDEQKMGIRTRDNYVADFLYDFKKVNESGFYRSRRSDVIEMNVRSSKLYTAGVMTGYLLVFTDLSLVAVQKRRIALFDSFFAEIGRFSKLGVCQFGTGGFASEQWNLNIGVESPDSFKTKSVTPSSIDLADAEALNAAIAALYERRISSFQRDVKVSRPDGPHVVNIHLSYSDAVNDVTAISIDVTEQREREDAIVRALRKAEQVEALRSRFFNNISHELRTPLNSIVGFSDLIAQTQVQGDFARYAGIIRRSNAQLLNLVDGIMEMSQLQTGNRRFVRQEVEVDSILSGVHDRMEGQQAEQVRFLTPHEPRMRGFKAPLDIVATSQILTQLVDNAFHFTKSGCVMLWASAEADCVVFHVSDTGCGIPADKLESIFDVFAKVDEFGQGAGLGLAVSRELARQLGGDVGVESTVGRGSHFFLRLPIFAAENPVGKPADRVNVVVLPHGQDLTLAVSLVMPRCNVFSCIRSEFSKVWMENRPRLSVIDVRECPDVAVRFIQNIRAFGDSYHTLVVNTSDSGIAEDDLLRAGASAVVVAPLTETSLSHVVSRLMGPDFVRMPIADDKRIIS